MSAPARPAGLSQSRGRDLTWRSAGIAFALLAGWITFLFRDTVAEMVDIWNRNETFTHCFLIAPISLWLIWRMRDRIAVLPPKPSAIATLALPFAGALWLASAMAYVNAAAQFAYVCMLIVAAVAVCGLRFARMATFPLAFLFLAIPVGEFALPTMMEWTADFTVAAVRLSGIPVYREGQQFVIPSGSWSVVEACSGVRYLIASYTVGALYAYLNYRSFVRRAIFFAFSVLVPIVANWLRAYLIVMLGHLSSNRLAVGVDHLIYGWLFFGVVIALVFWVGSRWAEPEAEFDTANGRDAGEVAASSRLAVVVVLAGLIAALPAWWKAHLDVSAGERTVRLELPREAGQWHLESTVGPGWRARFVGAQAELVGAYTSPMGRAQVQVAYYGVQDVTRRLVSSANTFTSPEDRRWQFISSGSHEATFASERHALPTAIIRDGAASGTGPTTRVLATRIYWIDGTITASDVKGKLATAWARLKGRGDSSAALVISVHAGEGTTPQRVLDDFLAASGDALLRMLVDAKGAR